MVLGAACGFHAYAQGPCGGKPCPVKRIERRVAPPAPRSGGGKGGNPSVPRPPRNVPPPCEDAELVVVCGMPGCEITIDGRDREATDDRGGIAFQVEGNRNYKIRVTKPGYESFEETVKKLACDEQREVKASLKAHPVSLRIRTQPANCDIYLDGDKQSSGTDSQGLFSYVLSKPTVLLEARKKGYLTAMKNIVLAPELVGREIVMALDPISATLRVSSNVEDACVTVDSHKFAKPVSERISLSPGSHKLLVDALGYAPITLELTVGPDESVKREVRLERFPLATLQSQATALFLNRAYDDVLKLCNYIRDADGDNATAHRLSGLVYLERGNFANAGDELDKALAGGESFALPVRRHPGEKFDLRKGHDACDAQLILSKNEVEFKSVRNPTENFKVTYDQAQVVGIQLKNSVAVYLSTKVNVGGKRRDYNFYSFDKELSQSGKAYLEMVSRLLKPH
jgi:hypothetical protein